MNTFSWIVERLKEPSTWAGIVGLLTAAGFAFSEELSAALVAAGVGVAGALAVIIAEKSKSE